MNWRHIVVDGCSWLYHVGRSYVVFRGPRRFIATVSDVKGCDVERGRWKISSDGMICPADIAAFLRAQGSEAVGVSGAGSVSRIPGSRKRQVSRALRSRFGGGA